MNQSHISLLQCELNKLLLLDLLYANLKMITFKRMLDNEL